MKQIIETMVILLGTLGWWGFVYPELSLLEVPYKESEEVYDSFFFFDEKNEGEGKEGDPSDEKESGIVIELPRAAGCKGQGTGEVRIKSEIAEYVYQIRNRKAEKEMQNDE